MKYLPLIFLFLCSCQDEKYLIIQNGQTNVVFSSEWYIGDGSMYCLDTNNNSLFISGTFTAIKVEK